MNRSSCASGSANVPSYSMGFWVAMTRNGAGMLVGDAVHRHLPLLHALEERRLGLGRRPVDLVGEHDLAHDRAGPELELLGLLVVDRDAGDVGRQQVGRELDAPEGAAERCARWPWPAWSCRCPGTSSMSRCPWHSSATSASRTSACLPTITRSTFAATRSADSWILDTQRPRGDVDRARAALGR